jgi:hypothetical protein
MTVPEGSRAQKATCPELNFLSNKCANMSYQQHQHVVAWKV